MELEVKRFGNLPRLFGYYGSKANMACTIIKMIPTHERYVEVFCGSAAVLLAKPKSKIEVVNDINTDMMITYKIIKDKTKATELKRLLEFTPYAREEFLLARDILINNKAKDDLERAYTFIIAHEQAFAAAPRFANWSKRRNSKIPRPTEWYNYSKQILNAHERLKEVIIENMDAVECIKKYDNKNTLMYLDPPYLKETRKKLNTYINEMTKEQHKQLLQVITKAKAKIILSGYENELYDHYLHDWNKQKYVATGGSVNLVGKEKEKAKRIEVLWYNYDIIKQLSLFEEEHLNV